MNQRRSPKAGHDRSRTRLYLAIGVFIALIIVVILAVALWRTLQPKAEPTLRLTPAAAAPEDLRGLLITSSGWPRGEQVTICLAEPGQLQCAPEAIVASEQADQDGTLEVSVQAGTLLAQGLTTVIARGQPSDLVVTKLFRVLQSPGQVVSTPTPTADFLPSPTPTPLMIETVTPTPTVPLSFNGWQAQFYPNPDLAGEPVLVQDNPELAFDWGEGSPDPAVPADRFSARWSQRVTFQGRRYRFLVRADDGVRLWIDGRLVLDEWHDLLLNPDYVTEVDLLPGEHDLVLEYFDNLGNALVSLRWQESTDFPDWRGEYFDTATLTGSPLVIRNDAALGFNWGNASPIPGVLPVDGFGARWTQDTEFSAGTYRFTLTADDGVRLLVDGQLLIDEWHGASSDAYVLDWTLSQGSHRLQVDYYEDVGDASVSLTWNRLPDNTPTPEPTSTATATATWSPTPSPEPQATATPSPTPRLLPITVAPATGWAGTEITLSASGWPADASVQVALLELGTAIDQAQDVLDASGSVGADGTVTINFTFPNQSRWLSLPLVQIVLHDPNWRLRGFANFSPVQP